MRKRLFRKTIRDTFRQIKQEEQMGRDEIDASWRAVEDLLADSSPMPLRKRGVNRYMLVAGSVAASVVLLISLSVWHMNRMSDTAGIELNTLIVPEGTNEQLILSDGTKIHVRANSHICYPAVFPRDHREITLVKGEIYLDVSHNPDAPFTVKANDFEVRVLGTQFNINLQENDRPASVVLVEGCVEIENSQAKKATLRPNQLADIFPADIRIQEVDVFKYTCWKDLIILLEEDKLGGILEQLSSFYGVEISCDKEIEQFALSGKLDLNDSVEQAIRTLELSTGFSHKKEQNKIHLYK